MVNFNPLDKDYIVRWQYVLENTKASILPVCDKPYHKIKANIPQGEELENVWNYPLKMGLWKFVWVYVFMRVDGFSEFTSRCRFESLYWKETGHFNKNFQNVKSFEMFTTNWVHAYLPIDIFKKKTYWTVY